MQNEENILMEDCCKYYSIETSFVKSLDEHGLIQLVQTNESYFIQHDELGKLERYMHFHYDLDINMEGMEAISHLLEKIEKLQAQLRMLKN